MAHLPWGTRPWPEAHGFEPVDGSGVTLRMDQIIAHYVAEDQVQAAKKERNKVC